AAFFAITGIAFASTGQRWIIGLERHRGLSFHQQCDLVQTWQMRFLFNQIGVESNGYQQAMVQTLQATIPVVGLHTGSVQKTDLAFGIPPLASEWEQGLWKIPYGDARSRRMVEPLIEELHVYPTPGHTTDVLMSCYFAREAYRTIKVPEPKIRVLRL